MPEIYGIMEVIGSTRCAERYLDLGEFPISSFFSKIKPFQFDKTESKQLLQ